MIRTIISAPRRTATYIVLAVVLAVQLACGDGAVVNLEESNFDDFVQKSAFALIFFHAPWCGHCQALHPVYEEAAATLETEGISQVALATIDAVKAAVLAEQYELTGYPTLKWFVNAEPNDYTGPRSAAGIVTWVKKRTHAKVRAIATKEELAEFKNSADAVVLGFFEAEACIAVDEDGIVAAFTEASLDSQEVPYATVSFPVNGVSAPAIKLFKKFDEREASYAGKFDIETNLHVFERVGIEAFVTLEAMPSYLEFLPHTVPRIFSNRGVQNGPMHMILFTDSSRPSFAKEIAALEEAYFSYKGDLINVLVDLNKLKITSRICDAFGIHAGNIPTLRAFDVNNDLKFGENEIYEPTVEHVEDVAMKFLVG